MPLPSLLPEATRDLLLEGEGRVAAMMRQKDWSAHPLGAPAGWPPALRTALGLVLNSPESMILAWGRELHFFFNDTYAPLLGPRVDWALGARFDAVWADAWEQARPIIEEALAGNPRHFVNLPWKLDTDRGAQDTWWTFSYSRVLDEAGAVAGLFIFTNETTARVLADAALERSQHELADALDEVRGLNRTLERRVAERTAERDLMWNVSPDLMAVIGGDGLYRRVNPAWRTVLGYPPEELVGLHATALVHPDDRPEADRALASAQADVLPQLENRLRHRDGSYRWISWVAAPGASEVFATGRHITESRQAADALGRAEEQLRQAQKLEAVGQLTGGVAHDFNNLLTVIRGSVDLLRRPNLSDERRLRYIDAIADTAGRATRLTGQLLAFARRQALKPETFDVGASLRALLPMMGTLGGARLQLALTLPEEPRFVLADRSQFDTAIINIAANARDAMGGAGSLAITVGTAEEVPATRAHPPVAGAYVAVALADTGAGIPAESIHQIFEPFFTTKSVGQGTGLGLSQVFGFAKQSGGDIIAASPPGGGATFTLYLPRVPAPQPAVADATGPRLPVFGEGARVLVVEDNPDVGAFATQALAELGYRSVLAGHGGEALALLDRPGERFDMLFTDVVMPGMSGVELAQAVRRRQPDLPILLTSGYSTVLAETGTHGFALLHKPYSLEELARTLQALAGHR